MGQLDLDALRAARAEARGDDRHTVKFGGDTFDLPDEPPAEFVYALVDGDIRRGLRLVLGDQYDTFAKHEPTAQDLVAFAEGVAGLYGLDTAGEWPAPPSS